MTLSIHSMSNARRHAALSASNSPLAAMELISLFLKCIIVPLSLGAEHGEEGGSYTPFLNLITGLAGVALAIGVRS